MSAKSLLRFDPDRLARGLAQHAVGKIERCSGAAVLFVRQVAERVAIGDPGALELPPRSAELVVLALARLHHRLVGGVEALVPHPLLARQAIEHVRGVPARAAGIALQAGRAHDADAARRTG